MGNNGNIPGWKMVDADTGNTIEPGQPRKNFRGITYRLLGAYAPPEGNFAGRVLCEDLDTGGVTDYYPYEFAVTIVPDVTVPDTVEAAEKRPPHIDKLVNEVADALSKLPFDPDEETVSFGVSMRAVGPCEKCAEDPTLKAVVHASERVAEGIAVLLADVFGELASTAYYAGLADGKAGKDGPDQLHCYPEDESGD